MINVEKIKPTGIFTNYIYKAIPLAFDESMSYYETLCGLLSYLKNTINPAINNNADALIELQNYVEHYFDNLDVQTEINNKLDNMVETGELQEILQQYIEEYVGNYKSFNGSVIYFADSYGDENVCPVNWCEELNNILNTQIFNQHREAGAGFIGRGNSSTRSWSTTLQNMVNTSTLEQRKKVKALIIAGGFNDRGYNDTQLYTAMNNFNNIVKANFPNATVYLAFIGWTIDITSNDLNIPGGFIYNLQNVLPIYSRCGEFGWKFLENCQYVMHDTQLFQSDKIHPNAEGSKQIASAIYSAINGSCGVHKKWKQITRSSFTEYFTASTSGNPNIRLDNEIITVNPTSNVNGTIYAKEGQQTFNAGTFYGLFNINDSYCLGDIYRPQLVPATVLYNDTIPFSCKLGFREGQFGFVPNETITGVTSIKITNEYLLYNTTQM